MENGKRVRLVCSDIDGTVLGRPEAAAELRRIWDGLGGERPMLVFSTGRLLDDAKRVVAEGGLPAPDYFIGGVGTHILERSGDRIRSGFSELLEVNWDLARAQQIVRAIEGIEAQPDEQQHEWKSSWFWHGATEAQLDELRAALATDGVEAQVIYSSSRDLDVLPSGANKGNALRWLCEDLGVGLDEVVVAGDTGNDASMFLVEGVRGIAVGNAEPELLAAVEGTGTYLAEGECAAGVLEGLRHFGVIGNTDRGGAS